MNPKNLVLGGTFVVSAFIGQECSGATYHLERVTTILNQPTFITQAPGDPPNILYYTTRISSTTSGFFIMNSMGKVWRYDLNTHTSTVILDLSARNVYEDDGLQAIAFHPDFNTSEAPGYGKMYVSSSEYGATSLDRVEEFTILNPDGSFKTPAQVLSTGRIILRYDNNAENNHTIDWIGFDPNATGAARDYLYISAGDSSFGNSYNGGISPSGRPSQNPADIRGKLLRVDISGGDDYPSDTNKNFAIPPSNPIPTYNAAHPSTPLMGADSTGPVPALGEVYVTGVRNGYRVSFDLANSDLYWGDVGENAYEEVDFLKADSNLSGPPVDYGWPQLEGTHNSPVSGAPHTTTNPFTGVTSLYPIQEYPHGGSGNAVIGGYVYHGPISELQDKYFYADFVAGTIWMLDFDRNTDPATFYGTNGVLTNVTALWNSLIGDPTDSGYQGDNSLSTINGLDHVVSFGEDNLGNLYVVDFGYGTGFNGQYTANAGEIFELVPDVVPRPTLAWTNTASGLQFSWSGSFKLQSQTNSSAVGFGTNWTDFPNGDASPITVPVDPSQDALFFRLISTP